MTIMNTDITVAIIGLVGVLVGAAITSFKEWWLHKITRKDTARYLSALLVSKLDKLSLECSHLAGDSGKEGEDGYYYAEHKRPAFELPMEDVDWTSLNPQVQLSVLNLPYRLESISAAVSNEFEHDSPPDFSAAFQQRRYLYAKLGIEASHLSDELRRTFGFPRCTAYDWNPVSYLEETIQSIDQIRERSQKSFNEIGV
ncbi:hypothetical protein [Pseudoxanthomonas spadix]|uniref:hypothetical protein n=1 Tax=Pseudoxanthomonas spadix TaxID=415229 RepID=UPI0011D25838|nr:hypothetical protein [Pseudoxanthomonas spadix]